MVRRPIVLGALGALALGIAAWVLGRRDSAPAPSLEPPPPPADAREQQAPDKAKPKAAEKPSEAKREKKPKPKAEAGGGSVTGYCVRDKKKVEIQDPKAEETKNGRPAIRGTCPECGGSIFRLGRLP